MGLPHGRDGRLCLEGRRSRGFHAGLLNISTTFLRSSFNASCTASRIGPQAVGKPPPSPHPDRTGERKRGIQNGERNVRESGVPGTLSHQQTSLRRRHLFASEPPPRPLLTRSHTHTHTHECRFPPLRCDTQFCKYSLCVWQQNTGTPSVRAGLVVMFLRMAQAPKKSGQPSSNHPSGRREVWMISCPLERMQHKRREAHRHALVRSRRW